MCCKIAIAPVVDTWNSCRALSGGGPSFALQAFMIGAIAAPNDKVSRHSAKFSFWRKNLCNKTGFESGPRHKTRKTMSRNSNKMVSSPNMTASKSMANEAPSPRPRVNRKAASCNTSWGPGRAADINARTTRVAFGVHR